MVGNAAEIKSLNIGPQRLTKLKIKTFIVAALVIVALVIVVGSFTLAVFRDALFDLYTKRLDAWVSSGGDVKTGQTEVVETCGKLVLSQAGAFERMQLLTFYRAEFDFRVDVCLKMTANRLYKQPEFEKPEMVAMICDDPRPYHELFRRLCQRSGLR
jgi:hypothetical protein